MEPAANVLQQMQLETGGRVQACPELLSWNSKATPFYTTPIPKPQLSLIWAFPLDEGGMEGGTLGTLEAFELGCSVDLVRMIPH